MTLPYSFSIVPTKNKRIQRWIDGCGYFKIKENYAFKSGCGVWQSPCGRWMHRMPSHAPKIAPVGACSKCAGGWIGAAAFEIEDHGEEN